MLSTKSPSDPSCSFNLPALTTDESAPQSLAIPEETPTPNFSIRDYVFASRSKSIGTSWPFKQHFLQLCLKHGVKDLLPPFEPPGLVRFRCCRKGIEPGRPVACSAVEPILPHVDAQGDDPGIRQDPCSLLENPLPDGNSIACQGISHDHVDAEIGLITSDDHVNVTSGEIGGLSCSVAVNRGASEAHSEIDIIEPTKRLESSREVLGKRCKLVVKLGIISENSRAEDVISNSSTVSDPMASKVCPVCKTFSSTSNTTLNAHIDQCLSMESNTKLVSSKFLKPKVKPGKKRLMVDIYTTAPHCTLEDLDKRNGTNWAVELAFATAPTAAIDIETKKRKLLPTDSSDDLNEGAVYVDSNGIKLRILSKLSDTAQPKEELKVRIHEKVTEMSKSIFNSKKKHVTAKYSKKMKMKAQSKKLSSFKLLKKQIRTASEGDHNTETHPDNVESLLHISDPGELTKCSRSASLRQWICSRRSHVSKKLVRKNVHSTTDAAVPVTRSRLAECSQLDAGNSFAAISHHLKLSRSSEDLANFQKSNKNNLQFKMVHSMDVGMEKSESSPISSSGWSPNDSVENGRLLRISKSSVNLVATSRRKTNEIHMGIHHQSDSFSEKTNMTAEICSTSMNVHTVSNLKKNNSLRRSPLNLESRKVDLSEKLSTCKRFRKHRSIFRSGRSGAEFQSTASGLHGSSVDILGTRESPGSCELDHSKSVTVSRVREMMNSESPSRKDLPESTERDDRSTTEEWKNSTLKKPWPGTECTGPDVQNLDMQVEVLGNENYVSEPSTRVNSGNPLSNDTVTSENLQAACGSKLEPPPLVEHVQSTSKSEVHVERFVQRSEKQELSCDDISRQENNGHNIQIADKMELTRGKDTCVVYPTNCTVDTMSIQDSSGCLTSHGDMEPEIPEKSTSITSVRTIEKGAMNLASDNEPCGSPVSTASTISLPSPKNSNCRDSVAEPFASAINAQDKFGSVVPITENTIVVAEGRDNERKNQELKVNLPANEPDRSVDDKPFCWSCRESLSRDSQLLRQSTTLRTARGKQVSNLFARPRVSSSFSSYQNCKSNNMVSSGLQPSALSTSAGKVPTCSDLGSGTPSSHSENQSNSNPILRLMGKNLMVGNNEEFVRPQSAVLDYAPRATILSSLGYASTNNLLEQENFRCHHQIFGGSAAFDPAVSMGGHQFPVFMLPSTRVAGFSVTPLHTAFVPRPDRQTQQKNGYRRPNTSQASHMMNEVIVIDDSPETDNKPVTSLRSPTSTLPFATSGLNHLSQRPMSYFSSRSHIRDLPGGPRHLLPNPYTGVNASLMKRGGTLEGHSGLPPGPFVFQSATTAHMRPSVCYSRTLR
ncbi:uncharacterized protein LOC135673010 isoform X1 [Musa acuminata AAA Group]|uniref:uncharacterized protein LOC135581744 isoform X1 n=1 Tax=Musa acuminata AAA Group TaxID=214697 RepID=UPI0031DF6798